MHDSQAVLAALVMYWPGWQKVQAVALAVEYDPAGHGRGLPAVLLQAKPPGQPAQAVRPDLLA